MINVQGLLFTDEKGVEVPMTDETPVVFQSLILSTPPGHSGPVSKFYEVGGTRNCLHL